MPDGLRLLVWSFGWPDSFRLLLISFALACCLFALLYPSISVWLCVRAWIRDVYTNMNQPLTIQALPKAANKRDFLKRICPAPKMKKIKRRPERRTSPNYPSSGFLFFLAFFYVSSSIQCFDFFFLFDTRREKNRKDVEALEHLVGESQPSIQPDAPPICAGSLNLYPGDKKKITINKHSVYGLK